MRPRSTLERRVTLIVSGGVAAALVIPAAVVASIVEPSSWMNIGFVVAFLTGATLTVIASVLIGRAAARAAVVPLQQTVQRLEALAEGDIAEITMPSSVEELDRLQRLVNQLVERTRQREQSFGVAVGALAHDARASLVAIKRALTLVASSDENAGRIPDAHLPGELVGLMSRELDRVQGLTSDLVMMMRSSPIETTDVTDLVVVIQDVVAHVRPLTDIAIDVVVTRTFERRVSVAVVDRVFRNVIENAASAARTHVSIEVLEGLIVVADDGPGIPDYARGHGSSPQPVNPSRPDHGFGMEIARRLAELAGGKIAIERSDDRGTRVLIYL